jgi:uncharacterized protein (DUF952 family)
MEHLFHIVDRQVWEATDVEHRPPSLGAAGFIHLCFAGQVAGVANSLYADARGLVVVEVDPTRLPGEVRIEDSYGSGSEFPHLYGPMPVAAVIAVHPLGRDADGQFTFASLSA